MKSDTMMMGTGPSARVADPEALRTPSGEFFPGWTTSLAAFFGLMIGPATVLVFCFGSFVAPLEKEFGWGVGQISLGGTVIAVMVIVTAVLAGHLVDRVGARRLALTSIPLFGLGVMGLYFLPSNIWAYYAALVVISLLGVGAPAVVYNKATSAWFDRHLGLSLGLVNSGVGFGAALLPMLVGILIPSYGWRVAYVVLGILAIVIPWPMVALLLKDRHRSVPTPARQDASEPLGLSFAEAWKTGAFWWACAGFFLLGAASSAVVFHQVRILVDTGMPATQAAAMQSVLGVSLIVGRVTTGWLIDHVRAPELMAALCVAGAGALALYAWGVPYNTAILAALLTGFVIGSEYDVLGFLVARYFGMRAFGVSYAVMFALISGGGAVAIAAVGYARGEFGSYSVSLGVLSSSLLLAAVVFTRLGPYRYPRHAS